MGRPTFGALGRDRDLPDPSFGLASDTLSSKSLSLDLYRRWGAWGYLKLWSPCDGSSCHSGNRQYCRGSDGDSDRWPRGPLLDVDGGLLWNGDQVCRRALSYSLSDQGWQWPHLGWSHVLHSSRDGGEVATTSYFLCGCRCSGGSLWDRNHDPGQFHYGIPPSEFWNGSRSG